MCIKGLLFLGLVLLCHVSIAQQLELLGQLNPFDSIQLNQNTPILGHVITYI